MAKTSAVQRNLKRIKMAKRYQNKRKKLKAIINNKKLPLNDMFLIERSVFIDERGRFSRLFAGDDFFNAGLPLRPFAFAIIHQRVTSL